MNLITLNRKVESEKEFKERNKYYQRKLTHQWMNIAKNPTGVSINITEILENMCIEGIITEKYKRKQLSQMYKELNSPNEFKTWCGEQVEKGTFKIKEFKKKAKQYLSKKFK